MFANNLAIRASEHFRAVRSIFEIHLTMVEVAVMAVQESTVSMANLKYN